MSVRTTLAPSRTKRCATAPPKPINLPLIAAAAPVSSATLPFSRILSPIRAYSIGMMRHSTAVIHDQHQFVACAVRVLRRVLAVNAVATTPLMLYAPGAAPDHG